MFGEVAALCDIPQPFTCRTDELSQLLRISKTRLKQILQEHREDSNIAMTNLLQVWLHFLSVLRNSQLELNWYLYVNVYRN
jgi:CRP-like cAMP-binding protein